MPDDLVRSFRRNSDGSWTCVAAITLSTPKGRIQVTAGSTFYPGMRYMGFDLARWLDGQLASQGVQRGA